MIISKHTDSFAYRISEQTTECESSDFVPSLKYHYQDGGRHFLEDPQTGEQLNIARLTAYAEYGDAIYDADAHHEIPILKIDAPRFIAPLDAAEHAAYHGEDPEPTEVDGFPLLREEEA